MVNTTTGNVSNQDLTKKNAFKILLERGVKLTDSERQALKSNANGCYYDSQIYKAWVCPIGSKQSVASFLEEKGRHATYENILSQEVTKTKTIRNINSRLGHLDQEIHIEEMQLLVETSKHGNSSPEDYEMAPIANDMDSSGFAVAMDFHKRYVALKDKKLERDNLRHSSRLHEEEDLDEKTAFTMRCINENERGDARLFLNIFKDRYVFDNSEGSRGEFYRWNGNQWIVDRENYRLLDIEEVALLYERAADLCENKCEKSLLLGRTKALRAARRCHSVFQFVAAEVPFKGMWDYCPHLLPCQNGIVELRSGELLKNTPERYIRSICPTTYRKGASSELFNQFLSDITLGDKEAELFLQKALGCCLIGDPKEEKIFIFFGERGRNGKGSLLQTCEKILGRYAHTFPSEMLLLQRNAPSSSAASPELANLQGVRLAIFSEIDRKRHIDAAKVKNLSGRDTIPCRRLFSNVDLAIIPTHTMIIQTNYKPKAPSDDEALWKRMVVVPFKAEVVENPEKLHHRQLDPTIKDRLLQEREAILAWLIEGARRYLSEGLEIPLSIRNETQLYRDENDGISAFIEQCCVVDSALSTPSGKLRDAIKEYCREEGYEEPSEREIKSALNGRFSQRKTNKGRLWMGIGLQLTSSIGDEEKVT